AAPWWAWHGVWGWGPRLVVPAVPLLAACAAFAMNSWPSWSRIAVLSVSVIVNVPGLLQHTVPVTQYVSNLTWPEVPSDFAKSLAGYAWRHEGGRFVAAPDQVLAKIPEASPFVVYPWFFLSTQSDDVTRVANALEMPPWHAARPDLVPTVIPMTASFVQSITGYPRWHFWGRGFRPSTQDATYWAVYDEGLADQVIRLQQGREAGAALGLARKLVALSPFGSHDALVLESYRILADRPAAAAYLAGLSPERRAAPEINVVLALFERDAGDEQAARQFLESVADRFASDAPLQAARHHALSEWPVDLHSMIAARVKAAGE
ncbi:MAG: tetratricopeptide repeat protein, partial [Bacteroidales bacterium]